jgi:hypothetical protein
MVKHFPTAVLILAIAFGGARSDDVAAKEITDLEVKAAFIYHFTSLVEWPPSPSPPPALVVAVVGSDTFAATLDTVIGKEMSQKRAIQIVRASTYAGLDVRPHVLFVGADNVADAQRVLKAVEGLPVLTVGDVAGFAKAGGMIGFRLTPDGRVSFDINLDRATAAHLKLSSQLLKIARVVKGRE